MAGKRKIRILLATCHLLLATASLAAAAPTAAQLEAGRDIYNFRCYFCHGYSGDARTVAASFLAPPPADFTRAGPVRFTQQHIVSVLRDGKPGTAMQPFRGIITDLEMERVAAFVMDEFVRRKAPNTRYHTPENGWAEHRRYAAAFPFATGEIPIARSSPALSAEQARGKRLFLSACVSCHDRGAVDDGIAWEARPLSSPRNNDSPGAPAAISGASPYALHDIAPRVAHLTPIERRGEKLYQDNCAFCHAADGTGKNWIGSFLEPHPRNLRNPAFMGGMTRARMAATIREGLPGTSMSAWKSVLSDAEIAAVVAYVAKAFHPLQE